jgi:hypothetical protein
LKIANLLAQYLYTNKRLDLPGIGTFLLNPSAVVEEKSKHHSAFADGISFQSNPSVRDAAALVSYISEKSGKMKVLAESDLESHLEIVQQFLNINKPFLFDGIGTLAKAKQGGYEFTPGHAINTRLKDDPEKDKQVLSKKDNVDSKYQAFLATPAVKTPWKKPVIALLILAGIGLAIWSGYTISNKHTDTEDLTAGAGVQETQIVPDSSQIKQAMADSIAKNSAIPSSYKYVLEVCKAQRAFKRLKTLKDSKLADLVQLETKDSVQYKLFVLLPVSNDTTKTIEELTAFLGKKVYIERQN